MHIHVRRLQINKIMITTYKSFIRPLMAGLTHHW